MTAYQKIMTQDPMMIQDPGRNDDLRWKNQGPEFLMGNS